MPGIGIEIMPSEIMKERSFIIPQIRFIAKPLYRQLEHRIEVQEELEYDANRQYHNLSVFLRILQQWHDVLLAYSKILY